MASIDAWRALFAVVSRIITPAFAVVAPPLIETTRAVIVQLVELEIGKLM